MYQRWIKRALDIALSLCGLIVLAPLMLLIILWIKLDSPGPAVFGQKRVGKNKTYFSILKFRTMHIDAPRDMPTHLLTDADAYITRCGCFLRKASLDELPQLINILRGEMSVVGPRPALWNQDDLVAERGKYGANSVTPGLTGWAQVNGRDELEINVKAKLDGEYARHITFKMDATCFIMTLIN
ncbi:MAG: sugar transferase, partial [Clostridia bacterium]|nr:sugar transferase [Clostridia bacterium]